MQITINPTWNWHACRVLPARSLSCCSPPHTTDGSLVLPEQHGRRLEPEVVVPGGHIIRRGRQREAELVQELGQVEEREVNNVVVRQRVRRRCRCRRRRRLLLDPGFRVLDVGVRVRCAVHLRGERGRGSHVLRRGGGGAGQPVRGLREVEVRGGAALDGERGDVVGARGHLRGVEGAEPDAGLLPGLAYLRHPLAPRPHAHAAVRRVLQVPPRPLPARVIRRRRRERGAGAGAVAAAGGGGTGRRRQRTLLLHGWWWFQLPTLSKTGQGTVACYAFAISNSQSD
ncbi:hypothetical protein D1007_23259 [Hordeum vulgare]|nr:hypothetical protein D1007_23259 [Hordeum vulgare]